MIRNAEYYNEGSIQFTQIKPDFSSNAGLDSMLLKVQINI
jgi:hypothetical protein